MVHVYLCGSSGSVLVVIVHIVIPSSSRNHRSSRVDRLAPAATRPHSLSNPKVHHPRGCDLSNRRPICQCQARAGHRRAAAGRAQARRTTRRLPVSIEVQPTTNACCQRRPTNRPTDCVPTPLADEAASQWSGCCKPQAGRSLSNASHPHPTQTSSCALASGPSLASLRSSLRSPEACSLTTVRVCIGRATDLD